MGIDTRNLDHGRNAYIPLSPLSTTYPDGDRDFSFYPGSRGRYDASQRRNPGGSDPQFRRIFHFGTLSSTHEGVREATRYALDIAKEAGCIITFDPNLRPPLWKSLEDARREIEYGLTKCDVLKISDNEVEFLFNTTDYDEGARLIREKVSHSPGADHHGQRGKPRLL